MSGGRRAPSLPVGAAVTSRAAAEALGGGEQLAPLRPPLSFLSVPPPTFPEFSLGLARLEGAEVAAVTGTSWGLRPRREIAAAATSVPPFPVALVSADRASIRGGCARLAAAGRAWGAAPRVRRRSSPPRGGAGNQRWRPSAPGERRDLGRRVNLSWSRLHGLRNGDGHGASFRKRSLRRRFSLPRRTGFFLLPMRDF